MGSFLNSLFSLMLGWFQETAAAVWNLLTRPNDRSFLKWVGEHWIALTAVLCLLGLALDFAVYLFRWQPYKVWLSFFSRLRGNRRKEAGFSESSAEERDDLMEDLPEEEPEEPLYYEELPEQLSRTEQAELNLRSSGRRRVSAVFSEKGQDPRFSQGPQDLIDASEAYHQPVYPRKWRHPEDQST